MSSEKCPQFNGDILQFDEFKERFCNIVIEDQTLNEKEKRQRLVDSLDPRCKCLIADSIADRSINALSLLEKIEAKIKSKIDAEIIRQITSVKQLDYNSREPWDRLLELIFRITQMKCSNVANLIPLLLNKVPESMVHHLQNVETFPDLIKFVENGLNFADTRQKKSISLAAVEVPRRQFQPRPCLLCGNGSHPTKHCNASQEEKRSAVLKKNLCFRCLQTGRHGGRSCPFTSNCDKCHGNHHSAVCGIRFVNPHTTPKQVVAAVASVPEDDESNRDVIASLN